jgi:transcription elongation GreA/GreB family factor
MKPINTQLRVQLEQELSDLINVERPHLLALSGATEGGDAADQADRAYVEVELGQVERRIDRLTQRLEVASRRPRTESGGDGLTVGVPLLLDFGSGPERAIVDATGLPDDEEVLQISGESPAGIAIAAACEGETVSYRVPDGTDITVKLVAVGQNAFVAA